MIYEDNKSSFMAEACADKWKAMKKNSFRYRLPVPTLYLCKLLNLFSAPPIVKEASFTNWSWMDSYCRPVRHTCPALPAHLPTLCLETAEKSEEDKHEDTDEEQEEGRVEDSELSEEEWSDLN